MDTDESKRTSSSPPRIDTNRTCTQTSHNSKLTRRQVCNLTSLVFAYACVICSTTLVVGSSAVIVLSTGGSNELSPFALASFFLGSAFVSLVISPIFYRFGRKVGFMVGIALGLLGAGLGALAIWISSPILVIVASAPLGAANGIGFYLRFAAVEVVSDRFKSLAVTLLLSGGVIAAFIGPETSQATRDLFGDDLLYLGNYMMIGIFNLLNTCFMLTVKFPSANKDASKSSSHSVKDESTGIESYDEEGSYTTSQRQDVTLKSLLFQSSFFIPCAMATASWWYVCCLRLTLTR